MSKARKFVTNWYFHDAGISRQVLNAARDRQEISPAGTFRNFMLYEEKDADLFILNFHIRNPKMLFASFNHHIGQLMIEGDMEPFSLSSLIGSQIWVKDQPRPEFKNLCRIICQYGDVIFHFMRGGCFQLELSSHASGIDNQINESIVELIEKLERFLVFPESEEAFLKEEVRNRNKSHLQTITEYRIRRNLRDGYDIEEIIKNAIAEDPKLEEKLRRFAARVKGAIKRKQGGGE